MIAAHADAAATPHDLWTAWNPDPLVLTGLVLAAWAYTRGRRGRRRRDAWRDRAFVLAVGALVLALLSPLDAASGALASAHMVQHLLIVLVAAPLLAYSLIPGILARAGPRALRRASSRWRRRLPLLPALGRALRSPAPVWLLHVGVLWLWHAAGPYDAALEHQPVHLLEHASFLITGVLFWRIVVATRGPGRPSPGLGVLFVFAATLQSTFLSLLLTFANQPWYAAYANTTAPWGLHPLTDQQLAGVFMWIPGGFVYLAAAIALMMTWIRDSEQPGELGTVIGPARAWPE